MQTKKNILFIVNPISGVGRQKIVEKEVEVHLDKNLFSYRFTYTQRAHHAYDIAIEASRNGVDVVAIVGGDGSVNECSKALANTATRMAIIPTGSGNGLARQLGIPCDVRRAVQYLNRSEDFLIDTGFIGEHFFVGAAGFGFDALIAHEFAKNKKRGFVTYIKIFLKKYFSYKPKKIVLKGDGDEGKYFVYSILNSGQYGNGAVISPSSKLDDGFFELVRIKKIPLLLLPIYAFRLFSKSLKNNSVYHSSILQNGIIQGENMIAHVDGEPIILPNEFEVKMNAKSLWVLC